jgi:hypothetical protein
MEQSIALRELQVERKHIIIELRENDRGRFLKITEEAHGRRNSVIIPSTGLQIEHLPLGLIHCAAAQVAPVKAIANDKPSSSQLCQPNDSGAC